MENGSRAGPCVIMSGGEAEAVVWCMDAEAPPPGATGEAKWVDSAHMRADMFS